MIGRLLDRLACRLGLHLPMPDGSCCICRHVVDEPLDVKLMRRWSS